MASAGWAAQLPGIGKILDSADFAEQLTGISKIVDTAGWADQLPGIGKILDSAVSAEQLTGISKIVDTAGWAAQLPGIGKILDSADFAEQLTGISKLIDAASWTDELTHIGTVLDEASWAQLLSPPPDTLASFLRDVDPFADLDEELAALEVRLVDDGFGPEAVARALAESRGLLALRRVAIVAFVGITIGASGAAPILHLALVLIHALLLKYPLVGVAIGFAPQGYRFGRWLLALDDDLEPCDGESR